MVHTSQGYSVRPGSVGCLAKKITYKGVASHAGGSPWAGRNALYAANCGLNAINAIRETFRESDIIRVHPIITSGGAMVNAIPDKVTLESYVRGSTYDGILKNNAKVNRALIGAALSLGANIEIVDMPGYAPLINDRNMIDIAAEAAEVLDIEFRFDDFYNTGSTDLGDLSMVMPVIQPYAGGARGKSHGNNYEIYDPEAACVTNAKWQLTMLEILLKDGAARAKKVIREYTPTFATKEEFLAFQASLNTSGDRIEYKDNNEAVIKL
jgi:metal-dependent amidase/aminoacylase/carboxypeptidase family protein